MFFTGGSGGACERNTISGLLGLYANCLTFYDKTRNRQIPSCYFCWMLVWEAMESFKASKRKNLQYTQLPVDPHCAYRLSSYIFRRLRATYFSSHLCLASWTEAVKMWALDGGPEPRVGSIVTLRAVRFPQNSFFEADNEEERVMKAMGGKTAWTAPGLLEESRAGQGKQKDRVMPLRCMWL